MFASFRSIKVFVHFRILPLYSLANKRYNLCESRFAVIDFFPFLKAGKLHFKKTWMLPCALGQFKLVSKMSVIIMLNFNVMHMSEISIKSVSNIYICCTSSLTLYIPVTLNTYFG